MKVLSGIADGTFPSGMPNGMMRERFVRLQDMQVLG